MIRAFLVKQILPVLILAWPFGIHAHEQSFQSLVIYHPYLIKENKSKALGFLSIENIGLDTEYLINIRSKFSSDYNFQVWVEKKSGFYEANLKEGVKIPPGEAIHIDQDNFQLNFLNVDESLEWLDDHVATFVFRNAGEIDLEFEVEE